MKKKFFLHTILYTVAPKLPTIAAFIVLPITSPYLTLEDYGKFGLVIACYSLFLLSVTLGQRVILQNSFFEYPAKFPLVWKRSYGIMTLGSILGSVLLAGVLYIFLKEGFNKEYFLVTGLCVFALIASPIESLAQVYYTLSERPLTITLRAIIMSVLNIIILIITIKYFRLGFLGLVLGFTSSTFFSLLFYLYPLCIKLKIYPLFFFKKKHFKEYLRVGLPLLPHNLSLAIFNTSDRMLLGFYKVNVSAIGLYSQGYGIGANAMVLLNGIFSAISKTLQLSFRNKTEENKFRLRRIFITLISGVGLMFFNICLWMKEIYMFLFRKPELQTGYPVAIIVLMSHIFFPLYSFGVYSLFITKNTRIVAKITFFSALINVILNLILIPFYGIWASLLTTSLSFIFLSIMVLFIKEVKAYLKWIFRNIVLVYAIFIAYGISLTLFAWLLKDVTWQSKIFITIANIAIAMIFYQYRKQIFSKRHKILSVVNEKIRNN